jgi:hypothetical protein
VNDHRYRIEQERGMDASCVRDFMTRTLKRLLAAAAVTVATAGAATLVLAPAAGAAELTGVITDVTVSPTNLSIFSPVTVTVTWCVPDGTSPGDTFTLGLPDQLTPLTTGFPLNDPNNIDVADATVVNKVATFTLTNYVTDHDTVCGSAHFEESFDLSKTTANAPNPVNFVTKNTTFPVVLNPTEGTGASRTVALKYGAWADPVQEDQQSGTDALNWFIDTPPAPPAGFSTAVFSDTAAAGQAFDCANISLAIGTFAADGNFVVGSIEAASAFTPTCSTTSLTVTANVAVPSGQALHLFIPTTVTDSSLASYSDAATVQIDGGPVETATALDVARALAGGQAGGVQVTSSPTTSASTTTAPATPTTTAPAPSTTASTVPATTGSTGPVSTATTATSAPRPSRTVTSTAGSSFGVSASEVGPSETSTPVVTGSSVATSPVALASTGSPTEKLLIVAGSALAAGGLSLAVAGRPRRRNRRH